MVISLVGFLYKSSCSVCVSLFKFCLLKISMPCFIRSGLNLIVDTRVRLLVLGEAFVAHGLACY